MSKVKSVWVSTTAKPSFETHLSVIKHNIRNLPTNPANINFIWNLVQNLKISIIDEFQKLSGMPMRDFFTNFQNGSMDNIKEFNTFVKQMTAINKVKKQIDNKIHKGIKRCQK